MGGDEPAKPPKCQECSSERLHKRGAGCTSGVFDVGTNQRKQFSKVFPSLNVERIYTLSFCKAKSRRFSEE